MTCPTNWEAFACLIPRRGYERVPNVVGSIVAILSRAFSMLDEERALGGVISRANSVPSWQERGEGPPLIVECLTVQFDSGLRGGIIIKRVPSRSAFLVRKPNRNLVK